MARPLRSNELTEALRFRVTPKERAEIAEAAVVAGLTKSDYIRRRVLGRKVPVKIDHQMINELRRQGGLLKHLWAESGASPIFKAALDEIVITMKRIAAAE